MRKRAVLVALCLLYTSTPVRGLVLPQAVVEPLKDVKEVVHSRNLRQASTCDSKWTDLSETHTMCLEDVGTEVELDQATKDALLEQHNTMRAQVSPPSTAMPKLAWDDELAEVAAKWARQCAYELDRARDRRIPSMPSLHVGQNAAVGYSTFASSVTGWYKEVEDFEYGKGSINGGVIGHYTQIVTSRSHRIGCGQADCPDSGYRRFYICNYIIGQYSSDTVTPYPNGTSCSGCPDTCDSSGRLCDCGGKMCMNDGSLNISNCQCDCPDKYRGETCEILQCPEEDKPFCGTEWPESHCNIYSNVPEDCPYMCGVCPAATEPTSNQCPDECTDQRIDPTNVLTKAPK